MTDTVELSALEARAEAGERFTAADVQSVLKVPDLISIGRLAQIGRRRASGDTVTFGRVLLVAAGDSLPSSPAAAGEVRLAARPTSMAAALDLVGHARPIAGQVPLTAFSAHDLFNAAGGDVAALAEAARALRAAGLDALAEVPLDAFESTDITIGVVRAIGEAGLGAWRLTVNAAPPASRLALLERAAAVSAASAGVRAFAPLPRIDAPDQPSTGYDDVRTVAAARLMCPSIRHIQVDWPLYGPKLAQVALLYGANDIDGVAAIDTIELGSRRSPLEDIRRQIRAAAAVPVERNGRYEPVS
jgi:hypothetical protein